MELGLIGLGKMGFNMATRLREGGHTVVVFEGLTILQHKGEFHLDLAAIGAIWRWAR